MRLACDRFIIARIIVIVIWPLVFVVTLAGCGGSMWSDRATNPVISDLQTPNRGFFEPAYHAVISTTAGRRSIFIAYKDAYGQPLPQPAICAEPPPDAIDAYTNALGLAANAGKTSGVSPELELSRSLAVSSGLGLYRSQGLQLLRDREFQLCIMNLRHVINDNQFVCLQQQTVALAAELINREMSAVEVAAGRPGLVVAAPTPPLQPLQSPFGGNTQAGKSESAPSGAESKKPGATGTAPQANSETGGKQPASPGTATGPGDASPSTGNGSVQAKTASRATSSTTRSSGGQAGAEGSAKTHPHYRWCRSQRAHLRRRRQCKFRWD